MPGGIQKTTPQRKQQPRSDGTPLETPDLVSSHLKEEVLEEDSTWVKEEEEEYDPSIDYRDHTEIKEEQEEDLPQEVFDGRDVSTIMRTLNIHEYPGQVTPNPHQHQQPPSSPAASPLNFPSPHYRSPSPGPSPSQQQQWHNPFSSPSKGWPASSTPSNHGSPSKFLTFSDTSSPSRHSDHESQRSPTPHSPSNFPSPRPHDGGSSNPPSPSPYAPTQHPESSPRPDRGASPFNAPSPSSSPLHFSQTPLSSPGLFHHGSYYPSFQFPGSTPSSPSLNFGSSSNAPSPSAYPDYPSQYAASSGDGSGKPILPSLSSLLNSLGDPVPASPSAQPFSREPSPFVHAGSASPYREPASPAPFSPSQSGSLPPFSSLLARPPDSPSFLLSLSNTGSPGSPFNSHFLSPPGGDSDMADS